MVPATREVVLVASPGGHMAQLRQLDALFVADDRLWVTFGDSGVDFASDPVLVCHSPTTRNLVNLARNLVLAARTMAARPPDLVVSTGAGPAVPFLLVGRLLGARTVFVEVYDRVDSKTLTGRLVRPFVDAFLVQWPSQARCYRGDVEIVGPLYPLAADAEPTADPPPGRRADNSADNRADNRAEGLDVFVTVGTDHHRFDRLVGWVGEIAARRPDWKFFVQHGTAPSVSTPATATNLDSAARLGPDEVADRMARADVVVTHGGPSTILEARAFGHRPIVVPRRSEFEEHIDDHQVAFAQTLADAGSAVVVGDVDLLEDAISNAARLGRSDATSLAIPAATQAAIAARLSGLTRRPTRRLARLRALIDRFAR